MHIYEERNKSGPQHTRLALAVGCALAFSLGAGVQAASPGSTDGAWLGEVDDASQLSMGFLDEPDWIDEDEVPERSDNPWAAEDELIRAVASGEIDPSAWMAEFAALESETEPMAEPPIIAATRVVTNCSDNGPGSLRDIVGISQNNDVIDMSGLSCSIITLDTFLGITVDNLVLKGKMSGSPGKYLSVPFIKGEADNTSGLLIHSGTGTVSLEKLTLQNGTKYGSLSGPVLGGCLKSSGTVSLTDVTITGCEAKASDSKVVRGGGVYAETAIRMTRSRISNSKVRAASGDAVGGGLFTPGPLRLAHSTINDNKAISATGDSRSGGAFAGGESWIDRSTISGNTAGITGGLTVNAGSASIRIKSSTVTENSSTGTGTAGGVYLQTSGSVRVANSTFTHNVTHGHGGPGLHVHSGETTLESNIISGNKAISGTNEYYRDASFDVVPQGSHNLIGWLAPSSEPVPADTIKQVSTPLKPLAHNGGHTPTHALKKGSWAMNQGKFLADLIGFIPNPGGFPIPIFEPFTDQTDAPRAVGAGADIGAYESDALFIGRFEAMRLY